MRLACLYVADLPLAALLRVEPDLRGGLVAVTDGSGPRAKLLAAAPAAARLGVRAGLTSAQAHAIAAKLEVRVLSLDWLRAAQAALCDAAESFSPRIEDAGDGVVYFDADGLERLYEDLTSPFEKGGSRGINSKESLLKIPPDPPFSKGGTQEWRLANDVAQRAAYLGLPAQVGIAGSKVAAYLAARDGGGVAVIPPGEEWSFLAPVPIGLLAPSEALAQTLRRWGIRTIGELAALPAAAVGTRLGPEGVLLVARARGEDAHPLVPRLVPVQFEESVELDYGIETVEPLLFVLRPLLERLTARLAVRGLVCGDVRLALQLVNRGRDERTVTVSAASNDVKSLLTLVRVHLELHPAASAVEGMRLIAVAEKLRPAQLDLFQPGGPAPAQLAVTLARLAAICGSERVGAPMVVDDHRPEAYATAPFNPTEGVKVLRCYGVKDQSEDGGGGAEPLTPNTSTPNTLPMALRVFRPPLAVEVFCQRDRPEFVRGAAVAGRVVQAAGPWRLYGSWWNEQRYGRDYYDAQLSDGGVYRLYCDIDSKAWFVEGSYD